MSALDNISPHQFHAVFRGLRFTPFNAGEKFDEVPDLGELVRSRLPTNGHTHWTADPTVARTFGGTGVMRTHAVNSPKDGGFRPGENYHAGVILSGRVHDSNIVRPDRDRKEFKAYSEQYGIHAQGPAGNEKEITVRHGAPVQVTNAHAYFMGPGVNVRKNIRFPGNVYGRNSSGLEEREWWK